MIPRRSSGRRYEMARLALLLALVIVGSAPASAMQCAPSAILVPALELTGEVVVWRGLSGGHLVLLMMHSQTPHAWTFIATSPGAITCVLAHGTDAELRDVRASASVPDRERPKNDRR
jgi:hypothetical protein